MFGTTSIHLGALLDVSGWLIMCHLPPMRKRWYTRCHIHIQYFDTWYMHVPRIFQETNSLKFGCSIPFCWRDILKSHKVYSMLHVLFGGVFIITLESFKMVTSWGYLHCKRWSAWSKPGPLLSCCEVHCGVPTTNGALEFWTVLAKTEKKHENGKRMEDTPLKTNNNLITCPLKRDYFTVRGIGNTSSSHWFSGDMLVFAGVMVIVLYEWR